MKPFKIDYLDHVAIRVVDLEVSADWYQKVLGLERHEFEEWGAFPIFLLSGKTGVALFPAHLEHPHLPASSLNIKIDHFAFHVSLENLELAKKHLESLGIPYVFKDHIYFHSIYMKDPDGHEVELTSTISRKKRGYEEKTKSSVSNKSV